MTNDDSLSVRQRTALKTEGRAARLADRAVTAWATVAGVRAVARDPATAAVVRAARAAVEAAAVAARAVEAVVAVAAEVD